MDILRAVCLASHGASVHASTKRINMGDNEKELFLPPELNTGDDEVPSNFMQHLYIDAAAKCRPLTNNGDLDHDIFEPDSPKLPMSPVRPETNTIVTEAAASAKRCGPERGSTFVVHLRRGYTGWKGRSTPVHEASLACLTWHSFNPPRSFETIIQFYPYHMSSIVCIVGLFVLLSRPNGLRLLFFEFHVAHQLRTCFPCSGVILQNS